MFKVVPDQLKISDGWVRCGHCSEVFDASAHLNPDGLPDATPPAPPAPHTATPAPEASASEAAPSPTSSPFPGNVLPPMQPPVAPISMGEVDQLPLRAAGAVRTDEEVEPYLDAQTLAAAAQANHGLQADLPAEDWTTDPDPPPPDVSFVREAQRKAFWSRPLVRLATGLVGVALLVGLAGQVAIQERDRLAAVAPALKPVLQAVCEPLGCIVQSPRQIDALVIDSSSFSKLRGDGYRLMFTLKNTAGFEVAMPAMELTLTDIQDQPVIRRVLHPQEFGGNTVSLGVLSEWQAQLTLSASGGGQRIAGYRLLAFYP